MCAAIDAFLAETIEPTFMGPAPAAKECVFVAALSERPSAPQALANSATAEFSRIAYRATIHMRAYYKQTGITASA